MNLFREVVNKKLFFGRSLPNWMSGVADSQTRSKPLKQKKITMKIAFFDPNFTLCVPKSHKNPWVGGLAQRFGKFYPNKTVFWGGPSLKWNDGIGWKSPFKCIEQWRQNSRT